MTVSHQIGEALWARYHIQCPDLSLKVVLEPEINAYFIGMRTLELKNGFRSFYLDTRGITKLGLGPMVADLFEQVDAQLEPLVHP